MLSLLECIGGLIFGIFLYLKHISESDFCILTVKGK